MKGVYPNSGKFVVRINVGSSLHHVGFFSSVDEASLNFDSASWFLRYPVSRRVPKFNNPQFSERFPPPKTPHVARLELKLAEARQAAQQSSVASSYLLRDVRRENSLPGTLIATLRAVLTQGRNLEAAGQQLQATARHSAQLALPDVSLTDPVYTELRELAGVEDPNTSTVAKSPVQTGEAVDPVLPPPPPGMRYRGEFRDGKIVNVLVPSKLTAPQS